MAILPKAQIITFTRAQSFDIKNRSKHLPDVVINVMCSSGLPGIDMAAGNFTAITCTLLSTLQQVHHQHTPPKKWKDVEARVLIPVLHWSVHGSDTVSSGECSLKFRRITVPLSSGCTVQEERLLDSYVKGTTALCKMTDYSPNQTVSHPWTLQCSCQWWLIKIICINSGRCHWYVQLTKQYKWKKCWGVTSQQFTTTCSRPKIQPVASSLSTMACQK